MGLQSIHKPGKQAHIQEIPNELLNRDPSTMFSGSKSSVSYLRYYKRWLGNLALRGVAEAISKDPSYEKNDYTINMLSQSNVLVPKFYKVDTDEFGVKVANKDFPDRMVFYRRKGPWKVARGAKQIGGAPAIAVTNHDFSAIKIFSDLNKWASDGRLGEQALQRISLLKNYMEERMLRQDVALDLACGSSSTAKSNVVAIIEDIGKLLKKHADNEAAFRVAAAKLAKSLDFNSTVFACKKFPLLPADLPITNFEDVAAEAAAALLSFFPNGSGISSALSKHLRNYVQGVLKSEFGVQILDRSTMDRMSEIITLLEISAKNEKNLDAQNRILMYSDKLDSAFSDVYKKIIDVERVLDSLSRVITDDPFFWAKSIFLLAIKRRKIFDLMEDLLPKNCYNCVALDESTRTQVNILLTMIALNLCKISERERNAWKDFVVYSGKAEDKAKKGWPDHFSGKERKAVRNSIIEFAKQADDEISAVKILTVGEGSVDRTQHKIDQDKLESNISDKIHTLESHSPAICSMLNELYESTRSHLGYRQDERLPPNIKDTYMSSSAILAAVLMQLEADPASGASRLELVRGNFSDSVRINSASISILETNPAIVEEMAQDIDKLLFTKSMAFDLETDVKRLRERGSKGKEIDVNYWLSTTQSDHGLQRFLNLSFVDHTLQVKVDRPFPGDDGFNPVDVPAPPAQDLLQAMYGTKLKISEFEPRPDAGMAEIYNALAEKSMSDTEKYLLVKGALLNFDLSTPHALLSVSEAGYQSGCIAPERFGRISPLILDAGDKSSLASGIEREFGSDATLKAMEELEEYKRVKVAERARRYIDANLPYYINKYAKDLYEKEIAQNKGAGIQH